jgi:hypothetical protein
LSISVFTYSAILSGLCRAPGRISAAASKNTDKFVACQPLDRDFLLHLGPEPRARHSRRDDSTWIQRGPPIFRGKEGNSKHHFSRTQGPHTSTESTGAHQYRARGITTRDITLAISHSWYHTRDTTLATSRSRRRTRRITRTTPRTNASSHTARPIATSPNDDGIAASRRDPVTYHAPCRNRTYNLVIKSHLLCQLS